ncbi:MAG: hypothetical protein QW594_01995 [Candidatus Woesearchaeota archaeon]
MKKHVKEKAKKLAEKINNVKNKVKKNEKTAALITFLKRFYDKRLLPMMGIDLLLLLCVVLVAILFQVWMMQFDQTPLQEAILKQNYDYEQLLSLLNTYLLIILAYFFSLVLLYTLARAITYRVLYKRWASVLGLLKYYGVNLALFFATITVLLIFGIIFNEGALAIVALLFLSFMLYYSTLFDIMFFKKEKAKAVLSSFLFSVKTSYRIFLFFFLFAGLLLFINGIIAALVSSFSSKTTILGALLFFELLYIASWSRLYLFDKTEHHEVPGTASSKER